MKKEHLLAEIEEVLRSAPGSSAFGGDSLDPLIWVGRASAVIERWNTPKGIPASMAADGLRSDNSHRIRSGYAAMLTLLNQARADLRMEVGPVSTIVQQGHVFDYFDQVRSFIEPARTDLLFVDPYLDADFIKVYMPPVAVGVTVRLLSSNAPKTAKHFAGLLSAAEMMVRQRPEVQIHIRSTDGLHDRFLFVDRTTAYISGASFKDGGKHAAVLLAQLLDIFEPLSQIYEQKWSAAKVER